MGKFIESEFRESNTSEFKDKENIFVLKNVSDIPFDIAVATIKANRKFKKKPVHEQMACAVAVANRACDELGMAHVMVEIDVDKLEWTSGTSAINTIRLSLKEMDSPELVDTIAHETMHCYVGQAKTPGYKVMIPAVEEYSAWRQADGIATESFLGYFASFNEIPARAFASVFAKKYNCPTSEKRQRNFLKSGIKGAYDGDKVCGMVHEVYGALFAETAYRNYKPTVMQICEYIERFFSPNIRLAFLLLHNENPDAMIIPNPDGSFKSDIHISKLKLPAWGEFRRDGDAIISNVCGTRMAFPDQRLTIGQARDAAQQRAEEVPPSVRVDRGKGRTGPSQ